MSKRIVITGIGVVAPNAVGKQDFEHALLHGQSGIRYIPQLAELNFGCQVGGIPPLEEHVKSLYFNELTIKTLKSSGVMYGVIAAKDAWADAGLTIAPNDTPFWDSGCIMGSGMTGIEALRDGVYEVDAGRVKKLGSRLIEQAMSSSASAHIGGAIGLGNQVTTNASACATGTEAIILAAERIRSGHATRMIAGGCDSHGPYVWGGFDSMRVLCRKYNDCPEQASRPMSATAKGFVPGSGGAAMVLEDLDQAITRKARIYAEYLGGALNSGGQRSRGSMTAPNSEGIQRCITSALNNSRILPSQIDAISGHLTATMGDPIEIENWASTLNRKDENFPYVNSLKSMIGHCLSAAGAIESVAVVLQLYKDFFHASINSEDLHPKIEAIISPDKVPQQLLTQTGFNVIAKSSFGFGDVNACALFKKWET